MVEEKRFLNAEDVAAVMECNKSHAYQIIKQLNSELAANGYIVLRGRVNTKYFYERIYDGKKWNVDNKEIAYTRYVNNTHYIDRDNIRNKGIKGTIRIIKKYCKRRQAPK